MSTFSTFGDATPMIATDYVVGLRAGVNKKFLGSSFLLAASNLSDVADAVASFDNISPASVLGDLITFDGTNNVRLGAGANTTMLGIAGGIPAYLTVSQVKTNLGLATSSDVTFNSLKLGAVNALTAFAGGGQGSATALTAAINRVTTVATAADSVKLPAALAGASLVVINAAAANAMAVFPQTGEIINALAANASISVAANKTVMFFCAVNGTWNSMLTA